MVMAMGIKSDMVAGDDIGYVICSVYRARGSKMRDSKRLAAIRQLPCCECGRAAPSQAAHSNFSIHGKGRGIKASDEYVIPLCHVCHAALDQYRLDMDRHESLEWFERKLKYVNEVLSEQDNQADF